jgi:hypothetical protein
MPAPLNVLQLINSNPAFAAWLDAWMINPFSIPQGSLSAYYNIFQWLTNMGAQPPYAGIVGVFDMPSPQEVIAGEWAAIQQELGSLLPQSPQPLGPEDWITPDLDYELPTNPNIDLPAIAEDDVSFWAGNRPAGEQIQVERPAGEFQVGGGAANESSQIEVQPLPNRPSDSNLDVEQIPNDPSSLPASGGQETAGGDRPPAAQPPETRPGAGDGPIRPIEEFLDDLEGPPPGGQFFKPGPRGNARPGELPRGNSPRGNPDWRPGELPAQTRPVIGIKPGFVGLGVSAGVGGIVGAIPGILAGDPEAAAEGGLDGAFIQIFLDLIGYLGGPQGLAAAAIPLIVGTAQAPTPITNWNFLGPQPYWWPPNWGWGPNSGAQGFYQQPQGWPPNIPWQVPNLGNPLQYGQPGSAGYEQAAALWLAWFNLVGLILVTGGNIPPGLIGYLPPAGEGLWTADQIDLALEDLANWGQPLSPTVLGPAPQLPQWVPPPLQPSGGFVDPAAQQFSGYVPDWLSGQYAGESYWAGGVPYDSRPPSYALQTASAPVGVSKYGGGWVTGSVPSGSGGTGR